jgi:hypothetical protein
MLEGVLGSSKLRGHKAQNPQAIDHRIARRDCNDSVARDVMPSGTRPFL